MRKKPFSRGIAVVSLCVTALLLAAVPAFMPAKGKKITPSQEELAEKAFWNMEYRKADSIYTAELVKNPGSRSALPKASITESRKFSKEISEKPRILPAEVSASTARVPKDMHGLPLRWA